MGWIPCRRLKTFYWRRALTQSTHRGITNMHSHTLSLSPFYTCRHNQKPAEACHYNAHFLSLFQSLVWLSPLKKLMEKRWQKKKYFCSVWYVLLCLLCFFIKLNCIKHFILKSYCWVMNNNINHTYPYMLFKIYTTLFVCSLSLFIHLCYILYFVSNL